MKWTQILRVPCTVILPEGVCMTFPAGTIVEWEKNEVIMQGRVKTIGAGGTTDLTANAIARSLENHR